MLDLNVIIACGTVFLMFLIFHRSASNANRARFQAIGNLIEMAKNVPPFKQPESGGLGFTDDGELYLLDEYKKGKRFQLIIDGNLVEDLSIHEWEQIAIEKGANPDGPIQFTVMTPQAQNAKQPEQKDGDNLTDFPTN